MFDYPLSTIRYPLSTIHYPLSVIHYPLSVIHYPLSTIRYPLSTIHYPLSTITNMVQIFGDYDDKIPFSDEFLILGFSPASLPLKQRWRNNGLSADFLADYLATFFPANDSEPASLRKQAEVRNAVSYIANELLENAMKFNDDSSATPVSIKLQLYPDQIVFHITNSVSLQNGEKFQAFIQKLRHSDTQELYIRQLEENAENDNSTQSRLGLLTMINDYQTKIGWKFQTLPTESHVFIVSTMVQLAI